MIEESVYENALKERDRWDNEHRKVLGVKNELIKERDEALFKETVIEQFFQKACRERDEARAQIAVLEHDWKASETHLDMRMKQLSVERAESAKLIEALKQISGDHPLFMCDDQVDCQFIAKEAIAGYETEFK